MNIEIIKSNLSDSGLLEGRMQSSHALAEECIQWRRMEVQISHLRLQGHICNFHLNTERVVPLETMH